MGDELVSKEEVISLINKHKTEEHDWNAALAVAKNCVDRATTVERRVKAHWIADGSLDLCSNCKTEFVRSKRNFCSECGADMRGEGNN